MKRNAFFRRLLLSASLLAPIGASAQVTIGSDALPQATLDIVGSYSNNSEKGKAFRLDDGNQADGKVLTVVGDNAVATWQYPALNQIYGVRGGSSLEFPLARLADSGENIAYKQTGAYITLPPGKWNVSVYTLITIYDYADDPLVHNLTANDFAWVRSTFSDSPTAEGLMAAIISHDITKGGYICGSVRGPRPSQPGRNCNGMIIGSTVISNTSNAPKTYYYVAGAIDSASSFTAEQVVVRIMTGAGESNITATPIM